ncbi:MAG TPA: ATP-binding protein [Polyangiaceae bacterium]|nr:ATP-binding protein [Polyangiaceae bacterium]
MYLEALLDLIKHSPITHGVAAVVEHFLEGTRALLPNLAVGACVVEGDGEAPRIMTLLPPTTTPPVGRDPSRLFPGFADEQVFELDDGATGSTFHVAAEVGSLTAEEREIAVHLREALGSMIEHARDYHEAVRKSEGLARTHGKLVQTEKLASLGQIVAGVVHELNNPLTSIIAYSDYLKKKTQKRGESGDDVSDDLERLRRIGEAAERILKFSRDLVAYARPSTDIPGPVVLAAVIEQAIVFCEHELGKNCITLSKFVEPDLPPVRGISGQLTQVFVNLFTNAAHAMHLTGGVLEIDARLAADDAVVVEVADNGVGVPEADLKQIFEPFYTTKVDGAGTGLGLSIVRDIVTQHGGTLTVDRRPERGTVFRLNLPVVALPPSMRPPRI